MRFQNQINQIKLQNTDSKQEKKKTRIKWQQCTNQKI